MQVLDRTMRMFLIASGLLQGFLLLLLHELVTRKVLTGDDAALVLAWAVVAVLVPACIQVSAGSLKDKGLWSAAGGMALVLTFLALYSGRDTDAETRLASFFITIGLGWFVSLPFIQSWLRRHEPRFSYSALFESSWSNANILILAAAFTGAVWLLLLLWAWLFKIIQVNLFMDIFSHRFFIYPATSVTFGAAVMLVRVQGSTVDALRRNFLNVLRFLLPLAAFISLLFLAALPFTGLKPLWNTGHATTLMLLLQLAVVLFLNAAYQDGTLEPPYHQWVRWMVQAATAALPVYTLLCSYSLGLRVDQHGWTVDRIWAALMVFVAGLYAAGYAASALAWKRPWMHWMGMVNSVVALLVIGLTIAVNTPLLDAGRIAAASQVKRLLSSRIDAAQFDYDYLKFKIGRHGRAALERLMALQEHPEAAEIRRRAAFTMAKKSKWSAAEPQMTVRTTDDLSRQLKFIPKGALPDAGMLEFLLSQKHAPQFVNCFRMGKHCALLALEMDGDQKPEYVLVVDGYSLFLIDGGEPDWKARRFIQTSAQPGFLDLRKIEKLLVSGDYTAVEPGWKDLRIGPRVYSVQRDAGK